MRPRFKWGGNVVIVIVDGDDFRGRRRRGPCGAKVLSLLILMAETGGDGFWQMFADQLGSETGKGGQMSATDGSQ
jgi:hypothetical protein